MTGKSITEPGTYTGVYPLMANREWLKSAVHVRHLDQMEDRLRALEKRLGEADK